MPRSSFPVPAKSSCLWRAQASPPRCWSAGPTCSRCRRSCKRRKPAATRPQLQAATPRRQQAAAEWFPRLFLSAVFGRDKFELNDMSIGASRFTNASALLAMPIFNAGRAQAINDVATSAQAEALARYEDGIVRALEDVENALVGLRDERQRAGFMTLAAGSAEAALRRAQSLYDRRQTDL